MALTKIDIRLRNKIDTENHYLCFFNVAIEEKLPEVEIKECYFSFKIKFLSVFLVGV